MTALFSASTAKADVRIDDYSSHPDGMIWIPGGTFRMGSDKHYPEEAPAHRVTVDGFWMDRYPVTNRQFREVRKGYRPRHRRRDHPRSKGLSRNAPAHGLRGLADVLSRPRIRSASATSASGGRSPRARNGGIPTDPEATSVGWTIIRSCMWPSAMRSPTRNGLARICQPKRNGNLRRAAGSTDAEFAWGDEFTPAGRHMANTWQGEFPRQNANADGFERTSPVTAFPPNGYGLHDMIGNVWEWTADWYSPKHQADAAKACCIPKNPRGGREDDSYDPRTTNVKIPQKVIKGGSHLCAPNYCRRYRPAARHAEPVDTSTSHLGFRCIRRGASDAS